MLLSSRLDLDAARSAVRDSILLLALVCVLNDSSPLSHLYTTHTQVTTSVTIMAKISR